MRSGYLKFKCELCGEVYTDNDYHKDVIDTFYNVHASRHSDIPLIHSCGEAQTGLAKLIGFIKCSEGNGW